jgi:predicted transcriptional regulator
MYTIEEKEIAIESVDNYSVFSVGQKKIIKILIDFDTPIPVDIIQKVAGASRQSFNFSIQSLVKSEFVFREKNRVFIYQVNKDKILELINIYKKQKELIENFTELG